MLNKCELKESITNKVFHEHHFIFWRIKARSGKGTGTDGREIIKGEMRSIYIACIILEHT